MLTCAPLPLRVVIVEAVEAAGAAAFETLSERPKAGTISARVIRQRACLPGPSRRVASARGGWLACSQFAG